MIIAVRRVDGTVVSQPNQTIILNGGDTVVVLGHRGDIPQFARFYDLKRKMRYRGAKT
ncbi:MAG: hypothetical protein ACFE0I_17000 [Elainellaceae cyanobacterium]